MAISLLESIFDELVCTCLIDVVLEPRKIEFVYAEADEVEEGFYIIYRTCCRVHIELPNRWKHGVPFEVFDISWGNVLNALGESEIDHVVKTISDADIVKFDVPMAEAYLV